MGGVNEFGSFELKRRPDVVFSSVPAAFGPLQGILQIPCEHRRLGSNDARSKGNEEARENPCRPVVFVAKHYDEDYSYSHETDDGYRVMLDGSQRIHGHLRECPILSYVLIHACSQQPRPAFNCPMCQAPMQILVSG